MSSAELQQYQFVSDYSGSDLQKSEKYLKCIIADDA